MFSMRGCSPPLYPPTTHPALQGLLSRPKGAHTSSSVRTCPPRAQDPSLMVLRCPEPSWSLGPGSLFQAPSSRGFLPNWGPWKAASQSPDFWLADLSAWEFWFCLCCLTPWTLRMLLTLGPSPTLLFLATAVLDSDLGAGCRQGIPGYSCSL